MADWGLYSALRGTDNWAQRRQDKAFNLQLVQKQQQDEQVKVQQSMKAEEEINKYFDEITGLDMLPEDTGRIQEVEKQSRKNIIKGIAAYNGDLGRYISSGGITDLHEYKNSILNSKAVKNAQMNKISMGAILKDFQDGGKYIHNVDVDIPELNPDGTQKIDEQGNALLKRKKVRPEEALKLFKDKVIDKINYNGSENVVAMNAMDFKNEYRDPRYPNSKNNNVTASDIIFKAMHRGASEDYANQLADSYINRYKATGETWKWNAMSDEEWTLQQEKTAAEKRKASGSGGGGVRTLNQLFPEIERLGDKGQAATMMMGNVDREWFGENLGLKYDSSTNQTSATKPIAGVDAQTGRDYDLSNALSINMNGRYVSKKNKNGIIEKYIEATVMYDADNPGANNPHKERGLFQDDDLVDDNLRHNWTKITPAEAGLKNDNVADLWKGTVLIPITEQIKSRRLSNDLEKKRGITSQFDAAAPSATYDDYLGYTQEQINQWAQEENITPQEVLQLIQEYQAQQ